MTAINLDKYLGDYLENRRGKQSGSTVDQKERICTELVDYVWAGDVDPDDDDEQPICIDPERPYVSLDTVRAFFEDTDLTLSQPYLSYLRDFLTFISKRLASTRAQDQLIDIRDKLTTDRWPDEMFESDGTTPEFIPDDSIVRACEQATTPRAELVIRFLYWTGCRIAEMRAVTPADIDFDADATGATIRISKRMTEDNELVHRTKTEAGDRTVELPNHAAKILQEYVECNGFDTDDEVFPMSVDTYRRTDVKQAFTRAGVLVEDGDSVVGPHWLRHQRNTRLREQYQDSKVARYMGHTRSDNGGGAGSEMTEHYTHYDPAEAQGLIDEAWVLE